MKIWEFFENLNEIVYVTDLENNEVVYMNKKALELYGNRSLEEVVGKKCYEVLHGASTPCAVCNNSELKEGSFKEWRYYNPVLRRVLDLKDTVVVEDGRRCRMEIAIEKGDGQQLVTDAYRSLETLANEGLRVALKAPNPDQTLEIITEYFGKILKGERAYVFERNEKGNDDNTYEWVANGISPEKDNLQDVPRGVCADWYQRFGENKNIVIEDLEEIREKVPVQYEILKRQKVNSLVVVPLVDEQNVIGFFGVDNPPADNIDFASNMLQIMGHFIVSSLKQRNLVRQLYEMSHHDQLTGFGNRYAMREYVRSRYNGDGLGAVYCDITGLKRVNDAQGHDAGDRLILRACECLRSAFEDHGLFRIGGDELLVLCTGISEAELLEQMDILREEMKKRTVVMACGFIWQESGDVDVDRLLNSSEERMRQEKAAYYKTLGIDRRR